MVATRDLKSLGHNVRAGSSPAFGTIWISFRRQKVNLIKNKKMKKSVFALMAAALTFVACGSKQEEAPAVEEAAVEVESATVSETAEVEAVEEEVAADELQEAPVQE